jgi:PTS system galactitol-specific IIA component
MSYFDYKLAVFDLEAPDQNAVLTEVGQLLFNAGVVKDTYIENVINREANYPTGLQVEELGFAIPHTDTEHVNQSQIAFARLAKPIDFIELGTDDKVVPATLIFMLALKEAHEQVDMLSKLFELFQNQEITDELVKVQTADEFYALMKKGGLE